jgi:hypothetical protein
MIERLNTTQDTSKAAKQKAAEAAEAVEIKTPDHSKLWTMKELMQLKRMELDKLAGIKGIQEPHKASNKTKLAEAILTGQGDNPEGKELTQQQEEFCRLYASDKEFFGNGVASYIEAYDFDLSERGAYQVAKANASRLLTNANLLHRIDEYLEELHLNDQVVDKTLAFLIMQKENFGAAVAAIREYNKLKGRTEAKKDAGTNLVLIQQNNHIHFNSPKARQVIENFDAWLMENTKAPTEGEANAKVAQVVQ